jgi:hypothetical protein
MAMTGNDIDPKLAIWAEQARQDRLTDTGVLTEFVVHNAELEQLEDNLRQFNIFEAIGMQWQELRHSAFLAFLLDPQQPHGLGDDFLKKVLQTALLGNKTTPLPVNIVKLHLMTLTQTRVERESNNIDILLLNDEYELAVVIENKVWTGEHTNQLDRYYRTIQRQYPRWRIIGLYLTPDGTVPSDRRYLPISYTDIAGIIETLVISRKTVLGPDVRTLMTHYVHMLRRNIVNDAEIDDLCRQIYQKHKRAIDLILARIPDKQAIVHEKLVKMIQETPGIRLRYTSTRTIGFHPIEWDVPALQYAEGKDAPALLLQFYIYNTPTHIKMLLELRRASEERRRPLFDMAVAYGRPFNSQSGKLKLWNALYSRLIVSKKVMPQLEPTDIVARAYEQFSTFLNDDLPAIKQALAALEWVWTTQTTDAVESGEVENSEVDEEDDEQ